VACRSGGVREGRLRGCRFHSPACTDAAYDTSTRIVSGKVVSGKVVGGKVVGGKVVVKGVVLDEGAVVTVVARDDDETFELSDEDQAALLAAIEEADKGEVVPAATVLERLRLHG
jgi:hypothetical protein